MEIWLVWFSIFLYNLFVILEKNYMLNFFYIFNVEDILVLFFFIENWSNVEDIMYGVLLLMK